jgi:hypothetical protein
MESGVKREEREERRRGVKSGTQWRLNPALGPCHVMWAKVRGTSGLL